MDTADLVATLRESGALKFGEFELAHGGTSDYYVDKYVFETDPQALESIAAALAERVDDETLAGVVLGAVPLVAATAMAADRPYVLVRKETKEYGTGNRIEGTLPECGEVVVIEDIATTGQSAIDAVEALREVGARVERVLVVVDREEGATAAMADHDVRLESLVTASDLLADADHGD